MKQSERTPLVRMVCPEQVGQAHATKQTQMARAKQVEFELPTLLGATKTIGLHVTVL